MGCAAVLYNSRPQSHEDSSCLRPRRAIPRADAPAVGRARKWRIARLRHVRAFHHQVSLTHSLYSQHRGRSRIMDAILRLIAGEQSPPLPDADARFRIFLVDLLGQRIALHPQHQNFHHRRPVSSAMLKRNYTTTRSVSF